MSLTKVSYSMIQGAVANILDYGAVSDYNPSTGAGTNNAAAIQAAITAVNTAGGGAVFIPAGKYRIDSTLLIPFGVSIFGEGGSVSTIYPKSCNGLTFNSAAYDNGKMFYQDFGMQGALGSTANWAAVECILPAGGTHGVDSRDGLIFDRLNIRNFNQGFIVSDLWESKIINCIISKVNNCISVGTYTIQLSIVDNTFIYESGDDFSGGADVYCVQCTGTVVEHFYVSNNLLYGFQKAIVIANAVYVNLINNDIYATVVGIEYVTINSLLNITGSYIQIDGNSAIGIYANGLATEINSQNNIENNMFISASGTTTIGLQINGAANTNAFYNRVVGNYFTGLTGNDIVLNSPGVTTVENNKCMSSGTTQSISISSVIKAPVYVQRNYFFKPIFLATPTDVTDGTLVLIDNVENNVYNPLRQAVAPTTGTWRVSDIVWNNAPAAGQPPGWVCTVAGTPGTWKAMANLI